VAAEVKDAFGIEPELVPGSGGIFNVELEKGLIFSKNDEGRFPNPGEIVRLIEAQRGPERH